MLTGRLSALAGAIGWASSGVVIKPVSSSVSAVQISAVYSWVGLAMVVPIVAVSGRLDDMAAMPILSAVWLVSASALYTSADLAFLRLLAMGAVGWTFVTTTSMFILFSLLAGIVLLGDSVTWTSAAGAAAIVGGIYMINLRTLGEGEARSTRIGLRLAISCGIALFWTAGLLATDIGVTDTDPFAATALLAVVPASVYALTATRVRAIRLTGIPGRDRRRVFLSALLFGASAIAFTYAVKFETAGITAILTSSSPLFAVLLAALFLKERLNLTALAGVALCFAGIGAVLAR